MFDELYNTVKVRFGTGSSAQPMGSWIMANTTIKKRPFNFLDYHFQKAIADDMHPDMSVKKCSQVGLTEVQIRKALAITARGNNISGIFTLPNEKMFTRVYNTRIKPILEADEIFNPDTEISPVRRRDTVQIRDSFLYITGCTEGDATSTPADFLFHDELDLSPVDMIGLYQSRLQNSDMRVTQKFSTPTFVGLGIDKSYALTDQREYLARCVSCNHWQIPRFTPKFIYLDGFDTELSDFSDLTAEQIALMPIHDSYVRCERCQKRLHLQDAETREWVATYPGRQNFRGYQVRPFSTGRLSPSYIFTQLAKYLEQSFPRGFHNTVLGEAYTATSAQVQRGDIEACMRGGEIPNVAKDTPVFLGVDIGFTCWLTLSRDDAEGQPVFVLFENFPVSQLETRINELRKIYNIVQGASDRFPFTPTVDALRDATQYLIMPIQYRGANALLPHKDELGLLTHYSANNTLILDRLHSMISRRKVVISGYSGLKETVITHLSDMVRDERPDVEAEWKKTSGNDHFFHAMALSLLARRVCDHMFHTQSGLVATSSLIVTTTFGQTGSSLMGDSSRLSRLG